MRNAERWRARARLACLACLATAAKVWAQGEPHVTGDPRLDANRAKAVDQGVADRNPLSASERVVPLDLRQPTGFERLFEITGPGGRLETRGTGGGGVFFRVSGALVATFPRSEYVGTPMGERALIPAGTVFSIGGARPWMPSEGATVRAGASPGPERSAGALGVPQSAIRSARRAAGAGEAEAARSVSERREEAAPESLWTNEAHRRAMLERLIRAASGR